MYKNTRFSWSCVLRHSESVSPSISLRNLPKNLSICAFCGGIVNYHVYLVSLPFSANKLPFSQLCAKAMASVLSLAPSSPLQEPYTPHTHHGFGRSCSSISSSGGSTGTVQHHRLRSLSGSSLSSLTSLWAPAFRRQHEESTPSRSSSSHNLTLRRIPTSSDRHSGSGGYSRRASLASVLSSRLRSDAGEGPEQNESRLVDVAESDRELPEVREDELSFVEAEPLRPTIEHSPLPSAVAPLDVQPTATDVTASPASLPRVRRWISTLRRRKQQIPIFTPPHSQPWKQADTGNMPMSPTKGCLKQHKHSDSYGSSLGFVTAVKSATTTLASVSIATVSRRNTKSRRGHQRSSLISGSDPRPSVDSQRSILDEAAKQRSRKRRAKMEELLRTEESYVADIRSLSNV